MAIGLAFQHNATPASAGAALRASRAGPEQGRCDKYKYKSLAQSPKLRMIKPQAANRMTKRTALA